jgi:shikimate kinase
MTNASGNSPFRGLGGTKIFLIGFMGSGKTYWGKKWAQQNELAFHDLDEIIEKEQGKTIAFIFEKEGEAYFRKLETNALQILSKTENCIIACGGGTPCFNDNINWMNEQGRTVYLSAAPQYLFNRIREEKDKRPLISKYNEAELLFFIEQKLKEREPFYKQASVILPVDALDENSLSALNL